MDERLATVVGQRIRRLRVRSGMGLREQARAIGISASSLSDLENARGGISLKRLQHVADHFDLHITDLLADVDGGADGGGPGTSASAEVFANCAATVHGVRRGRGVIYQVVGHGKGHAIQPALLTFEPGGTYEDDKIAHAGEEVAYVLLGDVELLLGEETYELSTGDLVRFRAEIPHAFRNPSAVGMAALLATATPPW